MNNYYTLHHLSKFLDESLRGGTFVSAISRKKRLLEFNFSFNSSECQLVFHTANPAALFHQDGNNDNRQNAATFFEDAWDSQVSRVQLDEDDRIVHIGLSGGYEIRLVAFGPGANAYLYSEGNLTDQFRNAEPPKTRPPHSRGDVASLALGQSTRDKVLLRDPRFPRQLLVKLIDHMQLEGLDDAELCMIVDSLTDTLLNKPVFRRLSDNTVCLLGDQYVPDEAATVYNDVNSLVRACWVQREVRDRYISRRAQLLADMESSMRRLETIIQGLEDDKQSKIRADHYETTGHILMAHSYMGAPISDVVELDDVYNPGNTTQIKVKSGASYSENAQTYYQKAKNTRKTIEANKDRLVESRQKLHNVQSLIMSFEEVDGPRSLERWLKANDKHIGSLLPSQRSDAGTGRPWRTLQIGKYDVWIGKSASGNDELLQASHKEDIWMHARHVSGSHVVVRMNKSLDFPPNDVIETAASWAAWYSKAKTAGIAPVVYTKRKYVRKSKGAAPGAATVDKEQVCLVEPSKPPNSAAE